jgi:hypothetical protein
MSMDWRDGALDMVEHLRGATFRRKSYVEYRPGWDHDHCALCGVKFMEARHQVADTLQEGFATTASYRFGADYEWLCNECFLFLKPRLGLTDETVMI